MFDQKISKLTAHHKPNISALCEFIREIICIHCSFALLSQMDLFLRTDYSTVFVEILLQQSTTNFIKNILRFKHVHCHIVLTLNLNVKYADIKYAYNHSEWSIIKTPSAVWLGQWGSTSQ